MAEQRARPLSPHLGVWRWGPGMAASIFHRVSGGALTLAGLVGRQKHGSGVDRDAQDTLGRRSFLWKQRRNVRGGARRLGAW